MPYFVDGSVDDVLVKPLILQNSKYTACTSPGIRSSNRIRCQVLKRMYQYMQIVNVTDNYTRN